MRLEKIKLAGFKSFVDPTTIDFRSNLTGVVGPNGCGKSNVIDAVRWVMGESSAKTLRGESITDVIFNGAAGRKPVGQASVELVFDNREGKLGGEYAQYSQISIKRQVNRDAQSTYMLNGTKCRRRDITGVFLGTGLGPRGYSIIEQGMISKLIEAKPEEMRSHLEEVSGISKYKERRRETENRIRRTRDNLDRLNDLREEIDKQLDKLKRQSSAAERYKVLKEDERLLKARSQALRWQKLDEQSQSSQQVLSEHETLLEKHHADMQSVETQTTKLREEKHEIIELHNEVQSQYYSLGADISRVEQAMQHYRERQGQLQDDLLQAETAWKDLQRHNEQDDEQLNIVQAQIESLNPELETARECVEATRVALEQAEQRMQEWQVEWDEFNHRAADVSQTAQVEQTRIQHIEQRQMGSKKRLDRAIEELSQINTSELEEELQGLRQDSQRMEQACEQQEEQLSSVLMDVREKREAQRTLVTQLNESRNSLQTTRGRFASLEALQQEALGRNDNEVNAWLEHKGLTDVSRLAQVLDVKVGWEKAVETVLGDYLQALCVDDVSALAEALSGLDKGAVTLFDSSAQVVSLQAKAQAKLREQVQGPNALLAMLETVYTAENLADALQLREDLAAHESVVTRDGVWLGKAWLRVAKGTNVKGGIILREQELKETKEKITQLEADVAEKTETLDDLRSTLESLEAQQDELQKSLNENKAAFANAKAQLNVKQARIEQLSQRRSQLEKEAAEFREQLSGLDQELMQARGVWQTAMSAMEKDEDSRESLLARRDEYREALETVRIRSREDRDQAHQLELQLQNAQTQLSSLEQSIQRMQEQDSVLKARCEQLQEALSHGDSPLEEMQQQLEESLEKRVTVEANLTKVKQALDENEFKTNEFEDERHRLDDQIEVCRNHLEQKRLAMQEFKVRRNTLEEQLVEAGFDIKQVIEGIPEELNEKIVNEELERTINRISRLGPINLAAIDEYKTQSERKEYLDTQNADLEEALTTLEDAIHKIDKETRQKFKETFDAVNGYFQEYFPKIFGGGQAVLELTGDDLLDAGVTVMARPPGKRNSTIHLLSGGEKALTAVALVFSMFQLNPAPFCMLDEVDAPLDDANVARFCRLVKEMSEKVQFIFISHNKVAIEMSNHLMGVTMHEQGVSRLVSVDMDEAVTMAEA